MSTKQVCITILIDNQAPSGLKAEHGLSFWIDADGKQILFDTGQGSAFKSNVRVLGVDLDDTDLLVLSHGHYDHTGGIPQALKTVGDCEIYAHPGIFQPRYSVIDGTSRPIGIPRDSLEAVNKLPPQSLHWVEEAVQLTKDIGITGPIPRKTNFEDTGGPFYLDPEGSREDPIDDDLALWFRTDNGLVVCVGCCHAGIVNTLNHVRNLSGESKIRAVIGGFHLVNADRRRLDETIAALRSLKPDTIIPCHCTGERAVAMLQNALGKRVSPGAAGKLYRFS